jgi:hypothetical protein
VVSARGIASVLLSGSVLELLSAVLIGYRKAPADALRHFLTIHHIRNHHVCPSFDTDGARLRALPDHPIHAIC